MNPIIIPARAVLRPLRLLTTRHTFATTTQARSSWTPGPSPPRLPKEEQALFEKLQQESTGAFSQPRTATSATDPAPPTGNETSPTMEELSNTAPAARSSEAESMLEQLRARATLAAKGDGEELHPNVRRGAAPEFEGDTNPKTGEVGGPKNEPLRWGSTHNSGDWSYNGRVTDF